MNACRRSLALGCLSLSLMLSRAGLGSHLPDEFLEAPEAHFAHTSSPLDAWLSPYLAASPDAFWDRYLASSELYVGLARMPNSFDWWSRELSAGKRFRFADPHRFVLLSRYAKPGRERHRPAARLWAARLAPERFPLLPELTWRPQPMELDVAESPLELASIAPAPTPAMKQRKCAARTQPLPVVVTSWGSDYDRLPLIDCDGNIEVDALDRISALARIMGQKRPELPLPDAPSPPEAWPEEWVDGVRLLHPRLLWILQRIGQAFPKHTVHLMSGYRRDTRETSPHRMGRALDISVRGVSKERLFAFCMTLGDVGCGYYPHHPFVHVDVRPFGTPKLYWVDASQPGQRSQYVDNWPGVVENGALAGANSE